MEIRDNPLVRLSFHFEDGVALQWKPGASISQVEVMRALGEMAGRAKLSMDIHLEDVPENGQAALLEVIRHASFNNLDGNQVAEDLEHNERLWKAVMMAECTWGDKGIGACLRTLRDLTSRAGLGFDTLFIIVNDEEGQAREALERLARKWKADEIGVVNREDTARALRIGAAHIPDYPMPTLMRIWWD